MQTLDMRTTASSATPRSRPVPIVLDRERWLAAVLLVGVATLFTLFVIVLQHDVRHAQLMHAQAYARAVAAADCERQPVPARESCLALLEGQEAVAAPAAPPENQVVRDWRRREPAVRTADAQ